MARYRETGAPSYAFCNRDVAVHQMSGKSALSTQIAHPGSIERVGGRASQRLPQCDARAVGAAFRGGGAFAACQRLALCIDLRGHVGQAGALTGGDQRDGALKRCGLALRRMRLAVGGGDDDTIRNQSRIAAAVDTFCRAYGNALVG